DLVQLLAPAQHGRTKNTGQPRFGKGLCSFFHVTDCLQVLAGSQLHLFDPCGTHLFAGEGLASDGARQPIARRYDVTKQDTFTSFPDQYVPFLALPGTSMEASLNEGNFRGTVFRMPLRAAGEKGGISRCAWSVTGMTDVLLSFAPSARSSVLFAQHLRMVSACFIPPQGAAKQLFSTTLVDPENHRKRREDLLANKEWKKSKLSSLFKPFSPPSITYTMEVHHQGSDSNTTTNSSETWVITSVLAPP
ncbi:unnamed protein product, partial [Chrysoparadoxa australica]